MGNILLYYYGYLTTFLFSRLFSTCLLSSTLFSNLNGVFSKLLVSMSHKEQNFVPHVVLHQKIYLLGRWKGLPAPSALCSAGVFFFYASFCNEIVNYKNFTIMLTSLKERVYAYKSQLLCQKQVLLYWSVRGAHFWF